MGFEPIFWICIFSPCILHFAQTKIGPLVSAHFSDLSKNAKWPEMAKLTWIQLVPVMGSNFNQNDWVWHFWQAQLYEGRLLWLLIFCQVSPGFAFKWNARLNPTLWNSREGSNYYHQMPLNSLGKRIMSLPQSDSSPANANAKDNIPASMGALPSNWLWVCLFQPAPHLGRE